MRTKLAVLSLLFAASMFGQATKPTTPPKKIPKFKYDGTWPKLPLPNALTFEGMWIGIVDRATGTTLDHFGFFSHAGGGFHWLHMVATDSKGNVYTGEVDTGKRVQRFLIQQ
jgi:hypothetical protein